MGRKKLFFWSIILGLNIIIPLILLEVGIRYVYWKPLYTPETLRQVYMQYEPSIFSQHAIAPWEQTPQGWGVSYHINSLGYRGREFDPIKPEGITRIVFLGGSSSFHV